MNESSNKFENVLPESMRPFVTIDVFEEPKPADAFLDAFRIATHCIAPVIRDMGLLNVIIGISPFEADIKTGRLLFELKPETIGSTFKGLIFLDCEKISSLKPQIQVACILEEFVHALMNVGDEAFVMQLVARLYDQVVLNSEGKYSAVAQIDLPLIRKP